MQLKKQQGGSGFVRRMYTMPAARCHSHSVVHYMIPMTTVKFHAAGHDGNKAVICS